MTAGATILDRILDETRRELARRREAEPLESVRERALSRPPARPFAATLEREEGGRLRVIAEIKKASPSRGLIREDFDPVALARSYRRGGAAAISVLTDEPFFQGKLAYLKEVREAVEQPLLRKDFTIDAYQVWEARAAGADAILLIVAALDDEALHELHAAAAEAGLDALVEVHDRQELERAARLEARLIGVNNRDLRTFEVDLDRTRVLLEERPEGALFISESGFSTHEELRRMHGWGVDAFLIGETLLRAEDPARALAALIGQGGES